MFKNVSAKIKILMLTPKTQTLGNWTSEPLNHKTAYFFRPHYFNHTDFSLSSLLQVIVIINLIK